MPSTPEDRAARRESRRLSREENPRRDNLAGYQTESARLFGVRFHLTTLPDLIIAIIVPLGIIDAGQVRWNAICLVLGKN